MEGNPVISQVSKRLLEALAQAMVPGMLSTSEDVAMATPYQEERDFRIGLYLYDLQDHFSLGSQGMERIGRTERRLPPKVVELHYLIFVNQTVPFSRARASEEEQLLEGAFRALSRLSGTTVAEGTITFSFLKLSEKIALWQGFSKPLQAALYITVSPVTIPSEQIIITPEVRSIDYHYQNGAQTEQRSLS